MKEKILIVDDETAIADLVGVYLENEGYEACKFHNAADALHFLERTQVSLAVLDVMLPDLDGLRFARRSAKNICFRLLC